MKKRKGDIFIHNYNYSEDVRNWIQKNGKKRYRGEDTTPRWYKEIRR